MFVSVHLTGAYLFLSQTSTMGALSEKDLCLSIYRMHHLHIFVVRPSAHGLFCGGISSENQCYHDCMYVAPTSACVRSPARSSHMSPIYMSPAGRSLPSIFINLKVCKHISQRAGLVLLDSHAASLTPSSAQSLNACLFMKAKAQIKRNLTGL